MIGSGRRVTMITTAALIVTAVAACSAGSATRSTAMPPPAAVSSTATPTASIPPSAVSGLPKAFVRAIGVNFGGSAYLATDLGLFRVDQNGAQRIGPALDLMSLTVVGPDHFYASGRPGAGSRLTDPLGLIESTDGGKTWHQRSLAGRSDFVALSSSGPVMFGFDGTVKFSVDAGASWHEKAGISGVLSLATAPGGDLTVVATTSGVIRLTGPGRAAQQVTGAPKLALVSWAALSNVVGVSSDGTVYASGDAGLTWQQRGTIGGRVQAMTAFADGEGNLEILAATATALVQSFDTGGHFAAFAANG